MRSNFANIHIDVFCFPSIHASHFAHCAGGVISSLYEGQLVTLAQVQVEETQQPGSAWVKHMFKLLSGNHT